MVWWYLDLQLHICITTNVVNSNPTYGKVNSIQQYVILLFVILEIFDAFGIPPNWLIWNKNIHPYGLYVHKGSPISDFIFFHLSYPLVLIITRRLSDGDSGKEQNVIEIRLNNNVNMQMLFSVCEMYKINLHQGVRVVVFKPTLNNISFISWRSVLFVEETRLQGKTTELSHRVHLAISEVRTHNFNGNQHWLHM